MAVLSDLINAVLEYSERYRHPGLPLYRLGPVYDLYPNEVKAATNCELGWPETWPNSDQAGVYAFLDGELNVIYVGKSSMNSFLGARLSSYCRYDEFRNCELKHSGWTVKPRYVWTAGMPEELAFEAPALEEYLIRKLQPTDNMAGK